MMLFVFNKYALPCVHTQGEATVTTQYPHEVQFNQFGLVIDESK